MNSFVDMTGQTVGRWTVIARASNAGEKTQWLCRCACGVEKTVMSGNLRTGASQSCGCWNREVTSAMRKTHGERAGPHPERRSTEYATWLAMKRRCGSPRCQDFPEYGGRGIVVCDRWRHDFAAFLADMGRKPSEAHSIDRIDTNGHYEPGNCRWATTREQCRNKRNNHRVTALGETRTVTEWGEQTGIRRATISSRLAYGWSEQDAVTRPTRQSLARRLPSETPRNS